MTISKSNNCPYGSGKSAKRTTPVKHIEKFLTPRTVGIRCLLVIVLINCIYIHSFKYQTGRLNIFYLINQLKMKLKLLIVLFGLVNFVGGARLGVLYEWKYLDWVWPNIALTGKNFTLGNPFTQDVDVDVSGRVFVTSPQWLEGTPITLSTISNVEGPGGSLLTPYPHWSWHTPNNCNNLVSVYRIAVNP